MRFPDFNNFIKRILIFFGGTDYDIFISYKRGEADLYGSALANYLTEKKYRCYFDQHVREEGQDDLPIALKKAVRNSNMLVILGTKQVDSSKWILQEIENYNQRKKKNIIPVNFGGAETQTWFEHVKIFHSPNESLENLETGSPSRLILETITNSFNFKKRNEKLQNRALFMIGSVIMLMIAGAIITSTTINQARTEVSKAGWDKIVAEYAGTLAKRNTQIFQDAAASFRKQKESADSSAQEAVKRQLILEDNNRQLQSKNVKTAGYLWASKNALKMITTRAKQSEQRFLRADSSSKWQENVAQANLLASDALQELEKDPTIALTQAKRAFLKHNSKMTMQTLYKCSIDQYQYKEMEGIRGFNFLKFESSDAILNSNGGTVQFNKLNGNLVEKQRVVKLDSLDWDYPGNIVYEKNFGVLIWYDKVDSSIAIVENEKVLYRKLPRRIAVAIYNEFRLFKIIDSSRIVYVDSSRTMISIFDWRENKIVATLNLNKTKKLKYEDIQYMDIWDADKILFVIFDSKSELSKIYSWNWKKDKKPSPSIYTDNSYAITSIQKLSSWDGNYLCIGNNEGELNLWNSKRKLLTIPIHDGTIKKMESYRDTLIVMSSDNKIHVFRYDSPISPNGSGKMNKLATFMGHTNELFDFDFNTQNGFFISSDTDYESPARLWQIHLPERLLLNDESPLSLFSRNDRFRFDNQEIGRTSDRNNEHFYLTKDSLSLPFIDSDSLQFLNVNDKKDLFVAGSKNKSKIYILDIKGNRIDSLALKKRKINQNYKEYFTCADFTNNDSLVVVVTNLRRSLRSTIDHIDDDYIVYVYNRNWEEITSFNVHSDKNVIVWNDYIYKMSVDSYTKTLINPALISIKNDL